MLLSIYPRYVGLYHTRFFGMAYILHVDRVPVSVGDDYVIEFFHIYDHSLGIYSIVDRAYLGYTRRNHGGVVFYGLAYFCLRNVKCF